MVVHAAAFIFLKWKGFWVGNHKILHTLSKSQTQYVKIAAFISVCIHVLSVMSDS